MFDRELLPIVRPHPSDPAGLVFEGTASERILVGKVRSPPARVYEVKNGYLDLLKNRVGADNAANLTNFLPGAGRGCEPPARPLPRFAHREPFSNEPGWGSSPTSPAWSAAAGTSTLDAPPACTRATSLPGDGDGLVGIDIPLHAKRGRPPRPRDRRKTLFARADAHDLPFADACFSGAVRGGTLNEPGTRRAP